MRFKDFLLLNENIDNTVYYHVSTETNTHSILRSGLQITKGDRSSQVEGEEAGIFLFRDTDSVEDALSNWLGDEFSEDERINLFEVTLPSTFPLENDPESWEVISRVDIPPSFIKLIQRNI